MKSPSTVAQQKQGHTLYMVSLKGNSNEELLARSCSGASLGAYRRQNLLSSPPLLPNNNEKHSLSAVKEGPVRNLDF